MMRGYGYGYGSMMGGWFSLIALVFWLLVIAGVVLLVVWGIRQLSGQSHGHDMTGRGVPTGPGAPTDQACEIARVRYAKGEITREQYDEMCRTLGMQPPPPPVQSAQPGPPMQPAPPAPPPPPAQTPPPQS